MGRLVVRAEYDLEGFSLHMDFSSESRRIGILGRSGSGKSMTLQSIAGIRTPDRGHIEVDGRILYDRERRVNLPPQKRRVGYLFQDYALFPTMNVEQNILSGLYQKNRNQREYILRQMIKRFRLEGLEKRRPDQLSGGQKQRTALARMIAADPEMILLDEPFGAADAYLKEQLFAELLQLLQDYPGYVLFVSHEREDIYRFSDTTLAVVEGENRYLGDTRELFCAPPCLDTARLTGVENTARAMPRDNLLWVPAWGLRLRRMQMLSQTPCWVGVRGACLRLSGENSDGGIPVRIINVYEGISEVVCALLPRDGDGSTALTARLRKDFQRELTEEVRAALGCPERIFYLTIPEEALLILPESGSGTAAGNTD